MLAVGQSRVLLITTGTCEERGLPQSLERLFPDLNFVSIKRDSFTSDTLRPLAHDPVTSLPQVASLAQKLAAELVAAVEPGQRDTPPEMVILVDDLELANIGNEQVVLAHIRNAVRNHLESHTWATANTKERATARVRERCSFHLLVPMVEAYFFGEPQPAGTTTRPHGALLQAGAIRPSQFDLAKNDVEAFHASESDFSDRSKRPDGSTYWATNRREQHPKQYVRFLCNPDPTDGSQLPYREGKGGAEALRTLDWHRVLSGFPQRAKFARSLFADIAERFNIPNPCPGELAAATAPKALDPSNPPVLRNL